MTADQKSHAAILTAFVVTSVAVAGYFTGLQAPMKITAADSDSGTVKQTTNSRHTPEEGVILATHYSEMTATRRTDRSGTQLSTLKSTMEPLAEMRISPEEKLVALEQRARNRAYNGAPPTVPHAIDHQSDASCVACHQTGAVTASLRIPRMSHAFLANCTQCHVESQPRHLPATVFRENLFAGLPAPTAGPRAFPGAPPQIPHTTWMRSDCMSCHGYEGRQGIRTTHPWRSNCLQCHTPSAAMEQTLMNAEPKFLPGPEIRK
jgi:cytochrome c-type protein NapB